jgi:2'-5' RNA ligase
VRCFVALDPPVAVARHLTELVAPLRGRYDVKWVPPDQMHLSLLFAGDLPPGDLDRLAAIVRELPLSPLALRLQHLGHFPPRGIPQVLFAGLASEPRLTALHAALLAATAPLQLPRDKRAFTPHLTLGRVRSHFGVLALVDRLRALGDELKPKPFSPTGLTLYTSLLRPDGADHRAVVRRPLPPVDATP